MKDKSTPRKTRFTPLVDGVITEIGKVDLHKDNIPTILKRLEDYRNQSKPLYDSLENMNEDLVQIRLSDLLKGDYEAQIENLNRIKSIRKEQLEKLVYNCELSISIDYLRNKI